MSPAPNIAARFVAAAATAAISAGAATAQTAGSSARSLAEAVDAQPRVRQLITISSPRWSSTTATLRAWRRPAGGTWVRAHGPVDVVLGYAGWVRAAKRIQSSGTTPAGSFRLPFGFGRLADPGAALRYQQYDGTDWWPYEPRDPATYNIYQPHKATTSHWRPDYSEHLRHYSTQYAYAVVVGFNSPTGVHYSARREQRVATTPADTSRGGGIFLHAAGAGLTAGCVAMPQSHVRWLLTWLDPHRFPRVAMGPHDFLVSL